MNPSTPATKFEFTSNGRRYYVSVPESEWRESNGTFAIVSVEGCRDHPKAFIKIISQPAYTVMKKLAELTCHGIPQILNVGELHDGRFFVITEYIDAVPLSELSTEDLREFEKRNQTDELFEKICRTVLDVCQSLASIGLFYRDLTPANILISAHGSRAWLIDVDSCCQLGESLRTAQFDQRFTLRYVRKIESGASSWFKQKFNFFAGGNFNSASASGAQIAALAFAAFLWHVRFVLDGDKPANAQQLLRSTSTKDENFLAVISSPSHSTFEKVFGQRPATTFSAEKIRRFVTASLHNSHGDWDLSRVALGIIIQSARRSHCPQELINLADRWEFVYLSIGTPLSARDVLKQWPDALDESVRSCYSSELGETFANRDMLERSVHSESILRLLIDEWSNTKLWVVREGVCRRLFCDAGKQHVGHLHPSCPQAGRTRKAFQDIERWYGDFLQMKRTTQQAWRLIAEGLISKGMHAVQSYHDDTSWNTYPPLADLFQFDRWQEIPWYQPSLIERMVELRETHRFEGICRMSGLFPDFWRQPEVMREAFGIREEVAAILVKGRAARMGGKVELSRQCLNEARELVADCPHVSLEMTATRAQ